MKPEKEVTEWVPRYLGDSIDDHISQLKIEYAAFKRREKQVYQSAVKYCDMMSKRQIKLTDKSIMKHDRALLIVRKYRRKYLIEWYNR